MSEVCGALYSLSVVHSMWCAPERGTALCVCVCAGHCVFCSHFVAIPIPQWMVDCPPSTVCRTVNCTVSLPHSPSPSSKSFGCALPHRLCLSCESAPSVLCAIDASGVLETVLVCCAGVDCVNCVATNIQSFVSFQPDCTHPTDAHICQHTVNSPCSRIPSLCPLTSLLCSHFVRADLKFENDN